MSVGEQTGLDATQLIRASRLSARVDNNAVGDGFQLYLHSFIVARDGQWVVIQQGMNSKTGMARRYHWHSAFLKSFIEAPHSGIAGHIIRNSLPPFRNTCARHERMALRLQRM
jgi:hypothetical protein